MSETKATRVDYRTQYWGHTAQLKRTGGTHTSGAPLFAGHSFGPHIRPGDELVIPMGSGRPAVFELTSVRTLTDPGDMHFIEAYPTHYLDEESSS
jgi:hypothetical protein